MELEIKKKISDAETNNALKREMVAGLFGIYQKGLPVPQELKTLETEILQNIALPLFKENVDNIHAHEAQFQAMQEQQQQEQAGERGGEEEQPQQGGEEEMTEEQMQESPEGMQEEQVTEEQPM